MFCSNCGKNVGEGNFCIHCGHKVGDVSVVNKNELSSDFFDKILFIKKSITDKQELAEARFNVLSIITYILGIVFILIGIYYTVTGNKFDDEELLLAKQIALSGIIILILSFAFNKLKQPLSMIAMIALNLVSDTFILISSEEYDITSVSIIIIYILLIFLLSRTVKDLRKSDKKRLIYLVNGILIIFAFFVGIGLYIMFS